MTDCLSFEIAKAEDYRLFWQQWGCLIESKQWQKMLTKEEKELLIVKLKRGIYLLEEYWEMYYNQDNAPDDGIDQEMYTNTRCVLEQLKDDYVE